MLLSRNKIKYLTSLKVKKYRNLHGHFIIEGEKIIKDILGDGQTIIRQLVATAEWLRENQIGRSAFIEEIAEADRQDLARISTLETPPPVLAVMDITRPRLEINELSRSWSLALDNIQDPGNMGTIIRTASWFGIRNILCSMDCVDCFNPKVVQASMGALLHTKIHYTELPEMLSMLPSDSSYGIYGTFMDGTSVFELPATGRGIIVFGNEAGGISENLIPFLQTRITIPPVNRNGIHVESLNVASAVAVVCAILVHKL